MGRRALRSRFLTYLGEACLLADRPDDVFEWAEQALALTRERGGGRRREQRRRRDGRSAGQRGTTVVSNVLKTNTERILVALVKAHR